MLIKISIFRFMRIFFRRFKTNVINKAINENIRNRDINYGSLMEFYKGGMEAVCIDLLS